MSLLILRKLVQRDHTLSPASRQLLVDSMSAPVGVKAGMDIAQEGGRPEHCTVLMSGWACRYSTLADGRRQTLALHISGDFVDLHSFPIKVMDHSVAALTDCTISTVPHARMRRITETDPHLTRVLWLHTLVDAAILRRWLLSAGQRSALERIAHLICELFTRMQVVGLAAHGRSFELPVSQQEFGDALGISSVHVSRMLTELRAANLLSWRMGQAEILDWEGLQRLAEFDPNYLVLHDEPR